MYIMNVVMDECLKCVYVKYKLVSFNMCASLGSMLASAYGFRNIRFFVSKT
jgi:hypothetical protein